MTYRYLTNLANVLCANGLTVHEVSGWKTRGRPASTGDFDPVGTLCHHTATTKATSDRGVVSLLINGRADLPGPLAQLGLGRDGTVHVIAAGRANHAGVAKSSGTVAAGDGNRLYIGIEAFNDGVGEPWPQVQYEAYVKLCAVLSLKVTGNSVNTVRGHKETSVTGKVDPTFDMDQFRSRVQDEMVALTKPPAPELPTFTAAHISGKWSAPRQSWSQTFLAAQAAGATVATVTETTQDSTFRTAPLPYAWKMARVDNAPGESECSIVWNGNDWEAAGDPYTTVVSQTTFDINGHTRPLVTTVTQPLTHKETGRVVLFQAAHAPSGVEGKSGYKARRAGSVEAHRETLDALHETWAAGRALHRNAGRVIGADWNLSYRLPWVRDLWANEFPGLEPCWEQHRPLLRGTHGHRLIDWLAVGVGQFQVLNARILKARAPKFDHRIVVADLAWRKS